MGSLLLLGQGQLAGHPAVKRLIDNGRAELAMRVVQGDTIFSTVEGDVLALDGSGAAPRARKMFDDLAKRQAEGHAAPMYMRRIHGSAEPSVSVEPEPTAPPVPQPAAAEGELDARVQARIRELQQEHEQRASRGRSTAPAEESHSAPVHEDASADVLREVFARTCGDDAQALAESEMLTDEVAASAPGTRARGSFTRFGSPSRQRSGTATDPSAEVAEEIERRVARSTEPNSTADASLDVLAELDRRVGGAQ
jgi:hypothetical protein